jgi:hypothetical protein
MKNTLLALLYCDQSPCLTRSGAWVSPWTSKTMAVDLLLRTHSGAATFGRQAVQIRRAP